MTKNESIGIVLRIASVIMFINVLQKGSATIPGWSHIGDVSITAIVFMILIPLLIVGILWKYAFSLSKVILPPTAQISDDTKWSLSDIEATAFTIIGVYVLSVAIPELFYIASAYIQSSSFNADLGQTAISSRLIFTVVRLIIGLWLVLGAKGLQDFLYKVRSAGKRA